MKWIGVKYLYIIDLHLRRKKNVLSYFSLDNQEQIYGIGIKELWQVLQYSKSVYVQYLFTVYKNVIRFS